MKLWGRVNSVNVQKVLWTLAELDLNFERIDAGFAYGKNKEPFFLKLNPNGLVLVLEDQQFVLWESNSIVRYLAHKPNGNLSALACWYDALTERPAFRQHVMLPLS